MLKSSYYYVCTHPSAEITLHGGNCRRLQQEGQTFLGSFYYYHQAMTVAKGRYAAIKPCLVCSEGQQTPGEPGADVKAAKPKARIGRPRLCAAASGTAKTSAGKAKKRQKTGECLTPAPMPKPRGYINRVPVKHLPENA